MVNVIVVLNELESQQKFVYQLSWYSESTNLENWIIICA
jgi:hypothetical protein